jgi:hypothetical protein
MLRLIRSLRLSNNLAAKLLLVFEFFEVIDSFFDEEAVNHLLRV